MNHAAAAAQERPDAGLESRAFLGLGLLAICAALAGIAPPNSSTLIMLLGVAVLLAGLPHGALDAWVAQRIGFWHTRAGLLGFNLAYVLAALAFAALWWRAPGPALALFLAISAWHFSGDWGQRLPLWARAAAGIGLIAIPAWRWEAQVAAIFSVLAAADGAAIARGLHRAAPLCAAAMLAAAWVAARQRRSDGLELGVAAALALAVPPLLFFCAYFCVLHSPRHLRALLARAPACEHRRLFSIALLYTSLALLGIVGAALTVLMASGSPANLGVLLSDAGVLRLVFIGLAALTVPHMIVTLQAERRLDRAA